MADKMMRIAGRNYDDQIARAIRVDKNGILNTDSGLARKIWDRATVAPSAKLQTGNRGAEDRKFTVVSFFSGGDCRLEILHCVEKPDGTFAPSGAIDTYDYVGGSAHHQVEFEIKSKYYQLRLTNTGTATWDLPGDNYEKLSNSQTLNKPKTNKQGSLKVEDFYIEPNRAKVWTPQKMVPNSSLKSAVLDSYGYRYLELKLFTNTNIYIEYIPMRKNERGELVESIWRKQIYKFEPELDNQNVIEFKMTAPYFKLYIQNKGSKDYYLDADFQLIFRNQKNVDNELANIKTELTNLQNSVSKLDKALKPDRRLQFIKSSLTAQKATQSHDGYFYIISNSNTIEKHSDITKANEPLETGVDITAINTGDLKVQYFHVFPDSVVYMVNDTASNKALIYQADSIQENPTMVHESPTSAGHSFWRETFGVDFYYNGVSSLVLTAGYGFGVSQQREAMLSTDGGRTFKVIKKTRGTTGTGDTKNSHFHDIKFDPYRNIIVLSEGDGDAKANTWYSKDLGLTWIKFNYGADLSANVQPTAIIPFPDRIVFGRDYDVVGLDHIILNKQTDLSTNKISRLIDFKTTPAYKEFSQVPVQNGKEAYLAHLLYDDASQPIVVATGDGGASWYSIWQGVGQQNIGNFFGMDDKYLYAYDGTYSNILYCEKPKWY